MPWTFIATGASRTSFPSQGSQGSMISILWLFGSTTTSMLLPSSGGAMKLESPGSKPRSGTSGAGLGGCNFTSFPWLSVTVSVSGLKDKRPARAKATVISGLVIKFMVWGCPSLRLGKLRLYDVTMVLGASDASRDRRHWPMQGPQALASTVPPMALNDSSCPSRSMVARTCSEPGVTIKGTAALMPSALACSATSAERLMSS